MIHSRRRSVADDRVQGEDGSGAVQAPSRSSCVETADVVRELAVFLPWRERAALATSAWVGGSPESSSALLEGPLAVVRSAYVGEAGEGVPVKAPQRRGEAFAALLGDIAVLDVTRRWPAVAQ
jgi:hypothetical protein